MMKSGIRTLRAALLDATPIEWLVSFAIMALVGLLAVGVRP